MNIFSEKVEILFNSIDIITSENIFIFPSIKDDLVKELKLDESTKFYYYKSPLFKELGKLVDKYISNCDLVYLDIADRIQAVAYQSNENYKMICLFRGTVNAIWNLCYQYCFDYDFYYTNSNKKNRVLNKKETRKHLFNILLKTSLIFIVLHEVGHIKLDHILKNKKRIGKNLLFELTETLSESISNKDTTELQELEIEADMFAAQELINMLDDIISSINKDISGTVGYIEAINFIIFSILTMLIHLQVILKQTSNNQDHPISLERINAIISVIAHALLRKPKVMKIYTEYLNNNRDIKDYLESDLTSDIGMHSEKKIDLFDENNNIDPSGFARILGFQTVTMVRAICEIQEVKMPQIFASQVNLLKKLGF